MMKKGVYGNFLIILLIIIIIAILGIAGFLVYEEYTKKSENKKVQAFIENNIYINNIENTNSNIEPDVNSNVLIPLSNSNNNTNTNTTNSTNNASKKYYNNYVMVGYIEIEKTNIKYPILETVTTKSLETSVAVLYPSNPKINQPGNTVIVGHNYRNQQFFSNNKKLSTGNKIKITDNTGKTLVYTIYEIFETTPEDSEYITRDRGNNIEISLSTCTDDSKNRLIILAKVQ